MTPHRLTKIDKAFLTDGAHRHIVSEHSREYFHYFSSDFKALKRNARPYGRGNVETDADRVGNEGTYRTLAARRVRMTIPNQSQQVAETNWRSAALTAVAGSGNCGEIANLAMHVYAPKLEPGDRMVRQRVAGIDHAWVRVQCATPEGEAPGSGLAAILDPWADGPAVDPVDSTCMSREPSR